MFGKENTIVLSVLRRSRTIARPITLDSQQTEAQRATMAVLSHRNWDRSWDNAFRNHAVPVSDRDNREVGVAIVPCPFRGIKRAAFYCLSRIGYCFPLPCFCPITDGAIVFGNRFKTFQGAGGCIVQIHGSRCSMSLLVFSKR